MAETSPSSNPAEDGHKHLLAVSSRSSHRAASASCVSSEANPSILADNAAFGDGQILQSGLVEQDRDQLPQSGPRKRQRTNRSRSDLAFARKRAITACNQCRVRKIKCNNVRPICGSCSTAGSRCEYEGSQDHSTFDSASLLILDRLSQVLGRLDSISALYPPTLGQITLPPLPQTQYDTSRGLHDNAYIDPSKEENLSPYYSLRVPPASLSIDGTLQWPIFGGRFPKNYITDAVYSAEYSVDSNGGMGSALPGSISRAPKFKGLGVDEDDTMRLVQRFLDLVHVKNPILDIDTVWDYARRVAEEGFQWDPVSCLILLVCALGCIAQPYGNALAVKQDQITSLQVQENELHMAMRYYNLAERRLGLVSNDILAPQCYFLAGVYQMYTLRPLRAWFKFHAASNAYLLYLKFQSHNRNDTQAEEDTVKRRRLEQRLYWSCYKAECELRSEMDLPQSDLAEYDYPDMYPSPPDSPSLMEHQTPLDYNEAQGSEDPVRSPITVFQHEQSWLYYLTEITLRRIANRVLNTMYGKGCKWDESFMSRTHKAAIELEQQLDEWNRGLPDPIQYTEGVMPENEIRCMVYGRALEIKCALYRPFLYFAVHEQSASGALEFVGEFAKKAIDVYLQILRYLPETHRHHGTWYGQTTSISAALCLIATSMSGASLLPSHWEENIWTLLRKLRYWEDEAPSVKRSIGATSILLRAANIPLGSVASS